jgi:hypothetical protein
MSVMDCRNGRGGLNRVLTNVPDRVFGQPTILAAENHIQNAAKRPSKQQQCKAKNAKKKVVSRLEATREEGCDIFKTLRRPVWDLPKAPDITGPSSTKI